MTLNSIRVRLFLFAALMIVLAVLASGISIALIFQRHVENRVQQELEKHFTQLVAALEVTPEGAIKLNQQLADPRFELPLSGLYWQVDLDGKAVGRSRSLWDERLKVPTPPVDATQAHVHELMGPDGQNLFSLEKAIYLPHQNQEKLFVITVGLERGEISDTVLSLTRDVVPALIGLGIVMLLATWLQVSVGLKPLAAIEKAVHGIREGGRKRIDESVAEEVKPLVGELNALLAANEERTLHARQRAADLAHGLRTPLTILGSLSRSVAEAGLQSEAEKIRTQTEHMRQQVERELAKVMSSAEETPIWLDLKDSMTRLTRVVSMGPLREHFTWSMDIAEDIDILLTRNDFNEIFGNIIENAQKWGKHHARIGLSGLRVTIEDDGPGVAVADIAKLTARGFTTGSSSASNGLGLAIASQLAAKNNLILSFGQSQLGGLAVQLDMPANQLRSKPT